jgi:hypothetical protein
MILSPAALVRYSRGSTIASPLLIPICAARRQPPTKRWGPQIDKDSCSTFDVGRRVRFVISIVGWDGDGITRLKEFFEEPLERRFFTGCDLLPACLYTLEQQAILVEAQINLHGFLLVLASLVYRSAAPRAIAGLLVSENYAL